MLFHIHTYRNFRLRLRHLFPALLCSLLLIFIAPPPQAQAHMSTIGYSDIVFRANTIQYSLYLDPQEIGQWIDLHGTKVFVIGPDDETKANENGFGWERSELERLVASGLTVKNNDSRAFRK